MKGSHAGLLAFAVVLALATATCGGHRAVVLDSGGFRLPAGWVKAVSSSGRTGPGWACSSYFHTDGGKVRVAGTLVQAKALATPSFPWHVVVFPRTPLVPGERSAVKMNNISGNPLPTLAGGAVAFEGVATRLAAGDYRVAIKGLPATYSFTAYVRE